MAIKKTQQGFALLIAIIFMSVMLSFGLTLGALAYKQQILASNAVESEYAFYAADAALECALYADQGQNQNLFAYNASVPSSVPGPGPSMTCDGVLALSSTVVSRNANQWVITEHLSLDAGKHCADVTIYKPALGIGGITYLFSQGYNIPCASVDAGGNNSRFVSRGLNAHYGS